MRFITRLCLYLIIVGALATTGVNAQVQPPNETPIPGGYNPCDNPRPPANCAPQVRPTPYGNGPSLGPATLHDESGRGYYDFGSQLYVRGDAVRAFAAYLQSAQLGYARGQAAAGNMLLDGEGVARDVAQGASWVKKAADQGHSKARYTMGSLYEDGVGVARDNAQALRYYDASAGQGDRRAAFRIGIAYAVGDIVPRDRPTAITWLRRAADDGFPLGSTIATLLADSRTPQFSSIDELSTYLIAQQFQAQNNARRAACGDVYACMTAAREFHEWYQSRN